MIFNNNEAMALASMNPMPTGMTAQYGAFLIDRDKDLKRNSWNDFMVKRDINDNKGFIINNDGKLDIIHNDLIDEESDIYIINNEKVDEIFNSLIEEVQYHIEERPIHSKSYLYEVFTGHKLYAPDQVKYDKKLEKIDMSKLSNALDTEFDLVRGNDDSTSLL